MTSKDIVRAVMKIQGFTQETLAKSCGMAGQSSINGALNRGTSMRVDTLDKILSAMGYEIVVREKGSHENEMVIRENGSLLDDDVVVPNMNKASGQDRRMEDDLSESIRLMIRKMVEEEIRKAAVVSAFGEGVVR